MKVRVKFKCPNCHSNFEINVQKEYSGIIMSMKESVSGIIKSAQEMLDEFRRDWL